eukprot:scaffold32796_cov20-Tisochrysis_lutea.AAC.6
MCGERLREREVRRTGNRSEALPLHFVCGASSGFTSPVVCQDSAVMSVHAYVCPSQEAILHDIDLCVQKGQLIMVVGQPRQQSIISFRSAVCLHMLDVLFSMLQQLVRACLQPTIGDGDEYQA